MSVAASALLGGLVFGFHWVHAVVLHFGRTTPWLWNALFYSSNTTAVAFWVVFLLYYSFISGTLTPAELEWERNLQRAEEIFRREKAAGRGSWWM